MAYARETPFKVAIVQAAPVFLDRAATSAKACDLVAEAGREGARLIAFPEAFIPAYPDWVWAVPAGEDGMLADMYAELLDQAVDVPGETTEALCLAAKDAGAYVVMGINERNVEGSRGSLFNTVLYMGPDGRILGKHRKLVPTGGERLVWAQGDGSGLVVHDTPFGRLGGLTCWENYMPLARYAMYAQGVQLYVAATWDRGEPWLSTLRHIAKEGRMVVLGSCMVLRRDQLPEGPLKERFYAGAAEWINAGDSAIVNPEGEIVAGPAHEREEILYAEIDPRQLRGSKWMLDVAGHYARPDIFELVVHTEPRPPLTLRTRASVPESAGESGDERGRHLEIRAADGATDDRGHRGA